MTPNSLTAEQRQLWVDALRSGEYKQGHGLLYNEKADSYCCIGVGARVMFGVPNSQLLNKALYWKGEPIFEGNIALSSMMVEHEGNYRYLTALNDVEQLTFDQIADLIEAYC